MLGVKKPQIQYGGSWTDSTVFVKFYKLVSGSWVFIKVVFSSFYISKILREKKRKHQEADPAGNHLFTTKRFLL